MVIQEVIKRARIEKDWLNEVYMGCAIEGENENFISPFEEVLLKVRES